MVKLMRDSSMYVAIIGTRSELDDKSLKKIDSVFQEIFANSATIVSDIKEDVDCEIIYEILTPVIKDDILVKDFFGDLEILFEVLQDYNPHFTQFKRGDINA